MCVCTCVCKNKVVLIQFAPFLLPEQGLNHSTVISFCRPHVTHLMQHYSCVIHPLNSAFNSRLVFCRSGALETAASAPALGLFATALFFREMKQQGGAREYQYDGVECMLSSCDKRLHTDSGRVAATFTTGKKKIVHTCRNSVI